MAPPFYKLSAPKRLLGFTEAQWAQLLQSRIHQKRKEMEAKLGLGSERRAESLKLQKRPFLLP